jgi:hypothetical protein
MQRQCATMIFQRMNSRIDIRNGILPPDKLASFPHG